VATAARLLRFKIENWKGKEKPAGVKPADILNWRLLPRVKASSVDKRLGADEKKLILEKALK